MAKELFFPDGESQHGREEDFSSFLQLFDGTAVDMNKTVSKVYSEKGTKVLRIYLCTIRKCETHPSKKVKFEQSPSNVECQSVPTESNSLCIQLPNLTQYRELMQFESPKVTCSTPLNETQPCQSVNLKPIPSNAEHLSEDLGSSSSRTELPHVPQCSELMQFESSQANFLLEDSVVFGPFDP